MKYSAFTFGISSLLFTAAAAAEPGPTREQDAQCFTAIARQAQAAQTGSTEDKALAKDLVRAEPYFGGKIRARFADAELPSALTKADEMARTSSKRREFAIACWQMFQLDMMLVTQAAGSGSK
jgi:hypothetical protein